MRVVGVDPGLAACGFAVVARSGGRLELLVHGCWQTKPGRRIELRLRELFVALAELIGEYRPDAVALEESFVGRNSRTALAVGQVRGALIVACAKAGIPVVEYAPATVKQTVCGYGLAEKTQVQQMAKALFGLEKLPTPSHAADAIAIGYCHATAAPHLRLAS
jgi:crossover junction endodeoxyribonuclease RuvC